MRIAHVTGALDLSGAGVRAVVERISALHHEAGHETRVFGLATLDWEKDAYKWRGAPAVPLPTKGPKSAGWAPTLESCLDEFDADVVHLHGLWLLTGPTVRRWTSQRDRPYFVSIHGMSAPAALSVSALRKRIAMRLYQRSILRDAYALIASSSIERVEITNLIADASIAVIPNGVAVPEQSINVLRNLEVLSIGRLDPIKGLDILLLAWADLESRFPSWRLRIAGPSRDGYEQMLYKKASDLGLQNFTIEGAIYGDERNIAMARAGIFVLPSVSENFALTVAEALAMETPVVASQGSPWSGLESEDCGLWVKSERASLVNGLSELMSKTPAERAQMGKRGRAWMSREFDWTRIALQYLMLYEKTEWKAHF